MQYSTEHNAGRMYINLTGGSAEMPSQFTQPHGGYAPGYGGNHYQGQQHHGHQQHQSSQQYQQSGNQQGGYPGQQQQYQGGGQQQQNQNQNQNAEIEAAVKKLLPRIIRKLEGCCVVM